MVKLTTQRLELIPATVALIHADLKGRSHLAPLLNARIPDSWPPRLTQITALLWFKEQLKQSPQWAGWFSWYWIRKEDRVAVGLGGFKGFPTSQRPPELGYSVLPEFQSRGFATEAGRTLTEWAFSHPEIQCVVAEAQSDRHASIRVLEKIGFKRIAGDDRKGILRFALDRVASREPR